LNAPKAAITQQNLHKMQTSIFLAEEMAARLGSSEILL